MSLHSRLERIADRFGPQEPPDYVAVVKLPDGSEHVALRCMPTIQLPGDRRDCYRPFFAGVDDRDERGRPLPVHIIEAKDLDDISVRYSPGRPIVVMRRDTRWD